jgi:hypothetical protein
MPKKSGLLWEKSPSIPPGPDGVSLFGALSNFIPPILIETLLIEKTSGTILKNGGTFLPFIDFLYLRSLAYIL